MNAKQLTKNFLSLFLSNVIGQLFILLGFVTIASRFGPEGFGKFSFAQVVGLYFLYLADFGLQTLGTRAIAQGTDEIPLRVRDITILRMVLALGSFGLLVIFAVFSGKPADVQMLMLVFGLALFPSAILFEWVFQGVEQIEYVGAGRVLKGLVFALLVYLFVKDVDHLTVAAAYYVLGICVAAAVLFAVYVKKFKASWRGTSRSELRKILSAAAPLAAGSFITQINYNFGTIALSLFLTDQIVGLFSASYKIVLFIWAFAVVAASNAVLPLLARSYGESGTEFNDSLQRLLRLFILVALPTGVGGTVLAAQIIGLLYAPEYLEGVIVFQLSIWTVVFVMYRVVFENALIASNSQRGYLMGYVVAGSLTVLGNLALVPVLGLIAPSVVGIVSEFALLAYFVASSKTIAVVSILRMTARPLLAAILMGTALFLVPMNLFVALALGAVLYVIFLLAFRSVTLDEVAGYVHSFVL